jgi:PAS domain-containing protein
MPRDTYAMGLLPLDLPRKPRAIGGLMFRCSAVAKAVLEAASGLALLSILMIAAIWGIAAFMIAHTRHSALEAQLRSMDSMGVVLVEQTSAYVQLIDGLTKGVQSRIASLHIAEPVELRRQLENQDFKTYLTERAKRVPQVETIAVIGADGQLINWSRIEPVGPRSTSERDYYRYLKDHNDPALFIGQLSKSIVTDKLALYFARRVSGSDGRFLGLILAVVDISYLSDFYKSAGAKLDETIALLLNDGSMLVRYPDPEIAIGLKLRRASPWYETVLRGGGNYTSVLTTLMDNPSLVSVHLLRNYPLVINILVDESAVFANWRREAFYISASALAASIAFVGLCWVLGRQFRRLSESALLLDEGKRILRSYAEMSVDWFWEQDADCRFKSDSGIPFMTGTDNTGKTRRDLGDPAMAEERWTMHEADLAARRPFRNFRWERIGSDGERRFINSNGDPVFDRSGGFTGYRGTGRDISAEFKAAAQLAEANTQLGT